jgi:hypothetical protein
MDGLMRSVLCPPRGTKPSSNLYLAWRSHNVASVRKIYVISDYSTLVAGNGERCKALISNSFSYRTDSLNP